MVMVNGVVDAAIDSNKEKGTWCTTHGDLIHEEAVMSSRRWPVSSLLAVVQMAAAPPSRSPHGGVEDGVGPAFGDGNHADRGEGCLPALVCLGVPEMGDVLVRLRHVEARPVDGGRAAPTEERPAPYRP